MSKFVRLTGDRDNPTEQIEVEPVGDGRFRISVGERTYEVDAVQTPHGVHFIRDGVAYDAHVDTRDGDQLRVRVGQYERDVTLVDERRWRMAQALGKGQGQLKPELKSPMAGRVVLVPVEAGQEVDEGDTIIIIEAMKMENEIRAEAPTRIKAIHVQPGDVVETGRLLFEFDLGE